MNTKHHQSTVFKEQRTKNCSSYYTKAKNKFTDWPLKKNTYIILGAARWCSG